MDPTLVSHILARLDIQYVQAGLFDDRPSWRAHAMQPFDLDDPDQVDELLEQRTRHIAQTMYDLHLPAFILSASSIYPELIMEIATYMVHGKFNVVDASLQRRIQAYMRRESIAPIDRMPGPGLSYSSLSSSSSSSSTRQRYYGIDIDTMTTIGDDLLTTLAGRRAASARERGRTRAAFIAHEQARSNHLLGHVTTRPTRRRKHTGGGQ